jgi:CRP-like cAMP-binding protein
MSVTEHTSRLPIRSPRITIVQTYQESSEKLNIKLAATLTLQAQTRFHHLLAALPRDAMPRLLELLELVDLKEGRVLSLPSAVCKNVYFPTSVAVSRTNPMENESTGGIALVGNDGVVGISRFLDGGSAPTQAVVHNVVKCVQLSARTLEEQFNRLGHLLNGLLRYVKVLITQLTQAAMCNRHHSVDQQFFRLLLQSLDRAIRLRLTVTHDVVGTILGLRRECVSMAAGQLRNYVLFE